MWEEMSYYHVGNYRTMQERLRNEFEPEDEIAEFFQDITYTVGYWLDEEDTVIKAKGD